MNFHWDHCSPRVLAIAATVAMSITVTVMEVHTADARLRCSRMEKPLSDARLVTILAVSDG